MGLAPELGPRPKQRDHEAKTRASWGKHQNTGNLTSLRPVTDALENSSSSPPAFASHRPCFTDGPSEVKLLANPPLRLSHRPHFTVGIQLSAPASEPPSIRRSRNPTPRHPRSMFLIPLQNWYRSLHNGFRIPHCPLRRLRRRIVGGSWRLVTTEHLPPSGGLSKVTVCSLRVL
jgi:hypothetical protein